jgi:mono/diheme cytochrome c family protein
MRVPLPFVCVTLSLALAAGCAWPGQPNRDDVPVPADRELRFGVLYGQNCAGCHGADGKLGPAPPLNDPLFRALIPEKELRDVISDGRLVVPGQPSPMPAFARPRGKLTAPQIQVLLYEIKGIPYQTIGAKTEPPDKIKVVSAASGVSEAPDSSEVFRPRWGVLEPLPKAAPPYVGPKDKTSRTSAQYEEIRKKVFVPACAGCHGDHGEGGMDAGRIRDANFLGLISDQALRRYVITGRPDFRMPDYAGKKDRPEDFKPLTPAQVDDLAALLASWR